MLENDEAHSKRLLPTSEEMAPAQKLQRNDSAVKEGYKKGRKESSSFRFIHGPPDRVNFVAQTNSVFQLVDPVTFDEPPPGFENFKNHTISTKRVHIAKVQGKLATEKIKKLKGKEKLSAKEGEVAFCLGAKGKTTLTIESTTGKKNYNFEAYKNKKRNIAKSNLSDPVSTVQQNPISPKTNPFPSSLSSIAIKLIRSTSPEFHPKPIPIAIDTSLETSRARHYMNALKSWI